MLVGGWSLDTRTVVSTESQAEREADAEIFQVKEHGTRSPIDQRMSLGLLQSQATHR